MIIQLSGAISSDPDYKVKFSTLARVLSRWGHYVINPVDVEQYIKSTKENPNYYDYLNECLELIKYVDAVFFFNDWKESYGARQEHKRAFEKGKLLIYQGVNENLMFNNEAFNGIYNRAA